MNTRWTVGAEYDKDLFRKLGTALKASGYLEVERWSGVGGSQEVSRWLFRSTRGELQVESETYMGLAVEGPSTLVEELKHHFQSAQ